MYIDPTTLLALALGLIGGALVTYIVSTFNAQKTNNHVRIYRTVCNKKFE